MKIDPDSVPPTVEKAVVQLVASLSDDDIEHVKKSPPESVHHFAGMAIRNNWSLWEPDSPLKRDAVSRFSIAHADDISGLIFAWAWCVVRCEQFDPNEHVKRYHRHWGSPADALVAGAWPPKEEANPDA